MSSLTLVQAKFSEAKKTVSAALAASGVEAATIYRAAFIAKTFGFAGAELVLRPVASNSQ